MKYMPQLSVLVALGLAASITFAVAPTQPAPSAPAAPKEKTGLSATLIATKDTCVLGLAQSGKAFRDKLEQAKNGRPPAPPGVDLLLRLTNNGGQPVTIHIGGDQSNIMLDLKGPGAITITPNIAMTMDYRMGMPVTIAPGKTHDIKITSLAAGARGISQYSYWTEPGDYTLAATLTTSTPDDKQLKITSEPVKLKVTAEVKK